MLIELHIENFAIIDRLDMRFDPGLVTFTGETGAGKSIIIDAVETLLGGRAESTLVRSGSERANVEGVFRIPAAARLLMQAILDREDLSDDESCDSNLHILTLGREIRLNGRNVARVNGRSVSAGLLRELGEYLVDVHGQSEHLSLLRVSQHLQMLDDYAETDKTLPIHDLLADYRKVYHRLQSVGQELENLQQSERDAARRIDMLTYQIKEIEAARLHAGEEEQLREERNRLANAEGLASLTQEALMAMDEGSPETPAITDLMGQVLHALGGLTRLDPTQSTLEEQGQTLFDSLSDLASNLRSYLEGIEFNPQRLDQVEERLGLIHTLKRKYGDTIQVVLDFAVNAQKELDAITHAGERIQELEAEQTLLLNQLGQKGQALSKKRHAAAEKLAQGIEAELADLHMSGARFTVDFQERLDPNGAPLENGDRVAFDARGLERIEFLIAPNPGEGFKPLAKIASGGETSRLMLALKNVLAQADQVPTLIFDEIDQGIGGRVGAVVGLKLWTLARQHQVFCITHLPQLAVFGEQHYHVQKHIQTGRTTTEVKRLQDDERLVELAQMLGGVSDGTLSSARELVQAAEKTNYPATTQEGLVSSPAIRNVPHIVHVRESQRVSTRRNPGLLVGLGCSALISILGLLGAMVLVLAYSGLTQGLPSPEALPALLNPPDGVLLQPTRLYDRSGEHLLLTLENPAAAGRKYLYLTKLAEGAAPDQAILASSLISATIATAEPGFWKNQGLSLMFSGLVGQPTIAQRLVSDLLFWDQPQGLYRTLQERLLATQVIDRFGREKVLEWYLNSTDFGHLAFGADAASRLYFGKPAAQLSLAEAALLAGVAEIPAFNPVDAPQAALDRQKQVIQTMLDQKLISFEQAVQAQQEPLVFRTGALPAFNPAPAFTNLVLEQLNGQFNHQRLERGGFRVITTLDYNLQLQAACSAATQLARSGYPQANLPASDGSECQAARLLPTLSAQNNPAITNLEANVVILDPKMGQILAMVGEPSPAVDTRSLTNVAHLPGRPPGTLLTPFIYLTAFTRGLSPASLVWDIPNTLPNLDIKNFDGQSHGPMRLRMALANDYLVPAVQMLAQLGPENVWRTAQQLGMVSLESPDTAATYRLPIEGGETTLLEASQAYGVFSNQGTLAGRALGPAPSSAKDAIIQPIAVQRVEDNSGQKIWLDWGNPQTRSVINPQLAYLTTNVLSDEAARWPSLGHPNPLEIGRPAAAKIGRTLQGNDTWTVGYTPQMVVGVWIGRTDGGAGDQPGVSPDSTGMVPPNLAAGLWHAVMQYAHRNLPSQAWAVPPGINQIEVCDPSGLLPTANCPSVVTETFIAGNEPTQTDGLYKTVQVNRETGRLATIFTPSDLVEDRNYLVLPPDAQDWARGAGIDIPPDAYDVILSPLAASADVKITSPDMFSPVSGKVPIRGSAQGADFAFYRVQVGEGLNPQQWLQVGQEVSTPVLNGQLAVWDTAGLDGLYVVQLLVVHKDQRVESTFVQVTVDNQAPEISILSPVQNQEVVIPSGGNVILQVSATDNLAVAKVEYYIDDKLVATINQPPFTLSWQGKSGAHNLRVKAFDTAGNRSETAVNFSVK